MTEAEKLLQETKSAVVAETQTEDICVIDSDLRIIDIPEQFKVLGVESDKDVRAMQFRIPKTYKGTDLSAFTISVNYQNARGMKDRYIVTDKKVSGDQIEFSWTVGKTATVYRGDTRFIVCMRLIGSDGVIKKEFNTTLATMTVLEGLEVDDPVIEQEEKDIIAQLLQIVDDKSKEAVQAVAEEGTKQIKAVQAAAQEIAADREQIKTNKADIADLMQTKAGAIINSARGERIAVGDSSDAFFEGLKLYGKSEQVQTKGYQLFDASKIPTKSAGGATVTNNGDGSFTISGSGNLTNEFDAAYSLKHEDFIKIFKPGTLTIKTEQKTLPYVYMNVVKSGEYKTTLFTTYDSATRSVNLPQEYFDDVSYSFLIGINGSLGNTIKTGTIKPMLYQDGDGTWEPFTGGKPSPSMEYKQDPESSGDGGEINVNVGEENTQHLSIQTPNGLPGIKVDSGGNYTDSNGQQWICDEMDFKRGKYVQRVKKVVLDGDEKWWLSSKQKYQIFGLGSEDNKGLPGLCDHFTVSKLNGYALGCETQTTKRIYLTTGHETVEELKAWLKENPVTVIYGLAYPIETDIPEETMTAYRNLYTNYPSTVIQNDSGAGMEVEYVADTKQFILDQIKALVQA